jgi:hypothetical protein
MELVLIMLANLAAAIIAPFPEAAPKPPPQAAYISPGEVDQQLANEQVRAGRR